MKTTDSPITLLLIEDDPIDIISVKRALRRVQLNSPLIVAKDGQTALKVLKGDQDTTAMNRPFLMLLDLNMPGMSGFQLLKQIRQDPELERSVVFILSSSTDPNDLSQAYHYNVAGYLQKPQVGDGMVHHMEMLKKYCEQVSLPC